MAVRLSYPRSARAIGAGLGVLGQGSQWARMGAELLATEPVFAATIAKIEPIIQAESGFR